MLSINTNTSSLIAQSSLKTSSNKLNQAIERMSSGAKINHAKDNAANYSIATNYSTKLSALQVAEDNVNMGLDMLSSSSEVLSQMEDNLSKIRALAVQAQNGTYGSKSLSAMNSEAKALMQEISRLNETAQYNGIKLFNTGKADVTNAGKELELNEQGFLQDVVVRDTSTMTKISDIDETQALAKGTYSISTVDDLLKLANMTNANLVESGCEFVLSSNIDLNDYCKTHASEGGWTPIQKFKNMIFDGNGYSIKNLYINNSSLEYQGLFSSVYDSKILNLKLENVNIAGKNNVGSIAGYAEGWSCLISNCTVDGTITGNEYVAGIVGRLMYTNIENCYSNGLIQGNSKVAGIVSYLHTGVVTSCLTDGFIKGINNIGGIVGHGDAVSNSQSRANVSGKRNIGGINGYSQSSITNCYFTGTVSGDMAIGGISGRALRSSEITNCIVDGRIVGNTHSGVFLGKSDTDSYTVRDSFYYLSQTGDLLVGDDRVSVVNVRDITVPTEYYLQVGTNSDSKSSSITLTTYVDFSALTEILMIGIEDESILEKIDELVNQVSLKQTEIGTAQNRLFGVLDEISTQYENLVSSRSTIMDADIAELSAEYIKMQILQQASVTLMATANQSPAIALQLL